MDLASQALRRNESLVVRLRNARAFLGICAETSDPLEASSDLLSSTAKDPPGKPVAYNFGLL